MSKVSRTAIVSGAARGIGAATAMRLGREGHSVALFDLDQPALIETVGRLRDQGITAEAHVVDVSDADQVIEAVASVGRSLGIPVVLVNNAGVLRDNLLFKMSVDDWDLVMAVHLRGAFNLAKAVQPGMRESGFGRIINISSTSALGNRGQANYASAKAGLQGFTKTLAFELGPHGITTNAVAPGFIVTDMTRATADRIGQEFDSFTEAKAQAIPVRRPGLPEDIAHAVAFFAGDQAGFVNGQVLYVAGGPKA